MILLLDTHVLIWALELNPKLSPTAQAALLEPANQFAPSVMSLLELRHLQVRGKTKLDAIAVRTDLIAAGCLIVPITEDLMRQMPSDLDIHDAIIVATGLQLDAFQQETVAVITADRAIQQSGAIRTIW